MWTSLREALVHAGVSTLEDDLRKEIMKYSQEALCKKGLIHDPWETGNLVAKMKKYLLVGFVLIFDSKCFQKCNHFQIGLIMFFSGDVQAANSGNTVRSVSCRTAIRMLHLSTRRRGIITA
jgi:hypothetical protein